MTTTTEPTEITVIDGRDSLGRFARGNAGGPGNPLAAATHRWRTVLSGAVSDDDLKAAIDKLVEAAREGEPWAIRELLDRCLGRVRLLDQSAEDKPDPAQARVLILQFDDRADVQPPGQEGDDDE